MASMFPHQLALKEGMLYLERPADVATPYHAMVVNTPGEAAEISGLHLNGRRDLPANTDKATKRHGMLITGGTARLDRIRVENCEHAGLYLYGQVEAKITRLWGRNNGFGSLVMTGHHQKVLAEDLDVEHLNLEPEGPPDPAPAKPGFWRFVRVQAGTLDVMLRTQGQRVEVQEAQCTTAKILQLDNPSTVELDRVQVSGATEITTPRTLRVRRCDLGDVYILAQSRYTGRAPGGAAVQKVFLEHTTLRSLTVHGSVEIVVGEGCTLPPPDKIVLNRSATFADGGWFNPEPLTFRT